MTKLAMVSNIGTSMLSPTPVFSRRYSAKPMAWALTRPVMWSVITMGTKRGSPIARWKVPATPESDWITGS